mmetsp:Transcript_86680/g.240373  ORF Transcript_86680/g.240373 Transcript_86680/m.240373 type:complete len:201 (+) Transcript_86680:768-1370(+)
MASESNQMSFSNSVKVQICSFQYATFQVRVILRFAKRGGMSSWYTGLTWTLSFRSPSTTGLPSWKWVWFVSSTNGNALSRCKALAMGTTFHKCSMGSPGGSWAIITKAQRRPLLPASRRPLATPPMTGAAGTGTGAGAADNAEGPPMRSKRPSSNTRWSSNGLSTAEAAPAATFASAAARPPALRGCRERRRTTLCRAWQ